MKYRYLGSCAFVGLAAAIAAPASAAVDASASAIDAPSGATVAAADTTSVTQEVAGSPDTGAQPTREADAGEIVVTATKQSSSLARTPAAITAISSEEIAPGGIQNIGDLQTVVPNVSIGDQFGVNRTFVRGIGLTSIDLGADGAVAFLQDGAMIARPSAQLSGFYDLDQIEVLRGPQGTIYGRGATGGAINLVVKKPTLNTEGYARLTLGNYQTRILEGAIGGPLAGRQLMVRVAGKYEKRDGYGKNLFTGKDIDDRDSYAIRGVLVSHLTDDFRATVIADHSKEDDANYAFHYFGPSIVPDAALPHKLIGGQSIFDYYAARGKKPNLRNIYSDEEPINKRKGTGVTGILDLDVGEMSFKSTTAWRKFRRFNRDDLDVSDVWMYGRNDYTEDSKSFSQEFTGTYSADKFSLLGGLMYFRERLFGEVRVPTINLGVLFGLPADTFNDGFYLQQGVVKTTAYGAFVQGTLEVTSKLKVTTGVRYNRERKEGSGFFRFDAIGVNVPTDRAKTWGAITPKLLVEYEPDAQTIIYGTVTRGFKSGVINVGSLNAVIDPEYVWNYEAGFKRRLFDRRILVSGAVFYYDYSNLQVGFVNAQSIVETINAASARNYGAELEVSGRINDQLSFNAYGAYLNAKFKDFCNGYYGAAVPRPGISYDPCPSDPGIVDLRGKRLPNAPSFSFGGGLNYTIPMGASKLVADADISYRTKVYHTEFNNYDAEQKGYALLNAGLTYQSPDERFSVGVWVKNVTDKYVVSNGIVAAGTFAFVRVGSLMPPRTFGLTLGAKF